MPEDLASLVPNLLRRSAHVARVELRGSRAQGTEGRFSDWDFAVQTHDFEELAADLPALVGALDPMVQQWDRLSDHACYMLIVSGPTKIDLIFDDVPHEHEPPWMVDASRLAAIDDHFWDWVLWLTSKADAGKTTVVAAELEKMYKHLLAPMSVPTPAQSLGEAVNQYLEARDSWAQRLGIAIDRQVEHEVVPLVEVISGGSANEQ